MSLDGKLVATIPPGRYREVMRLEGDEVEFTSEGEFSYAAELYPVSRKEAIDDREIPQAKPPMNVLQMMHQEFRKNMGVMREAFDSSDIPWPGYEIDDDEETIFEEEIAEKQKEAAKEAAKKAAKAKAEAAEKAEAASPSDANDDKSQATENTTKS